MKGLKFRAAGPTFAQMWQAAGASIVSVPSNEIYNAFQTGVAEGTDTSMGSFLSFRLYEQAKCLTTPGNNALWFMYEPVLMSKKSFDKLDKKQQDVLIAGRQESAEVLRGQGRVGRRGDDQGVQGSRRRDQEPDRRPSTTSGSRWRRRVPTQSSRRTCRTARN